MTVRRAFHVVQYGYVDGDSDLIKLIYKKRSYQVLLLNSLINEKIEFFYKQTHNIILNLASESFTGYFLVQKMNRL